jgi:rfaE bifunctional protein kinase chain/domain
MVTKEELQSIRNKANGLKAMVVGDAMLDRYIYGTVDRISPEAPVPILAHQLTKVKAGGSANVAQNLAAWGCQTSLVGIVGSDRNADELEILLEQQKIKHKLIHVDNRPTTVKTRVVASSHHLLRIDEESSVYLDGEEEDHVINEVMVFIGQEQPNLLIIQDYNKGLLTEKLISRVTFYCNSNKVFLSIDPKEENFLSYRNADLFKPNLREASLAAQKSLQKSDLSGICETWRKKMNIHTIAITLGGQGLFLQNQHNECLMKPDRSVDVVDVCGAGDAVICSLSLSLMGGLSLEKSGIIANLTGAYVCSHSGVVATDPEEIQKWLS